MSTFSRVQLRQDKESAFTIIEVLAVAFTIGVMTAIAVPNFVMFRQAADDDKARSDAVSFSMKASYEYQHEGILPTDSDIKARVKPDEDNRMAIVSDGSTVCLLAYNLGGKEYTYENPFVLVDFEALPDGSAPVSCPLDITAASWS